MKTMNALKSSTLAVTLALLATSGQISADQRSPGLWGEQFQNAYNGVSAQASTRSGPSSLPIWAGHFEDAYTPPTERSAFASYAVIGEVAAADDDASRRSDSVIDHLLWRSKYPL